MVTLKEVAKQANVGTTTASVILNRPEHASRFTEETIERVRKVAQDLNYHPNHRARMFRGGRSNAIGIVLEGIGGKTDIIQQPYWASLLAGVHQAAQERRYQLSILSPLNKQTGLENGIQSLNEKRIDGLLIGDIPTSQQLAAIHKSNSPIVTLNHPGTSGLSGAYSDDCEGVRLAIDYLREHGHEKFLWVGPVKWFDESAERRANTFASHCVEHGLQAHFCRFPWNNEIAMKPGAAAEQLRETFAPILQKQAFTAIVCYNNDFASTVVSMIHKKGVRIPEDISIVIMEKQHANFFYPPLTCIDLCRFEIGRAAGGILLDLVELPATERMNTPVRLETIMPTVVENESVTAPPAR